MTGRQIGTCGACRKAIFVDMLHECLGVRLYRVFERMPKGMMSRWVALMQRGADPTIAAELVLATVAG